MAVNGFNKINRLISKIQIQRLFTEGNRFYEAPFSVLFLNNANTDDSNLQIAISVPKKKIASAVKRNLIKRRIREAFRTQNGNLMSQLEKQDRKIIIMIIYSDTKPQNYSLIKSKISLTLQRLSNQI
jgi:ribonuclease P protein component